MFCTKYRHKIKLLTSQKNPNYAINISKKRFHDGVASNFSLKISKFDSKIIEKSYYGPKW